ncbi:testis-expressed protein 2 [Aplochiton taeniatus]
MAVTRPAEGSSVAGANRGIVIQLTGTEGEWGRLADTELMFSMDHHLDYPSVSLSKLTPQGQQERPCSEDTEPSHGLRSPAFPVPHSPSSPGSLDCTPSSSSSTTVGGPSSFLSPSQASPTPRRPLASLVKSLSTELELKEGSSLRPRPLLSLVKSISTEISRSEPEVSMSKSDSRLNLHLWKQLTQPKGCRSNGDGSRTAPPSPSALSPSGDAPNKTGFFKMELEDTKRKFSEAMHEPLSMFSKIMGEETAAAAAAGGSPKHQGGSRTQPAGAGGAPHHSSCSPSTRGLAGAGKVGREAGSAEAWSSDSPGRGVGRTETETSSSAAATSVFDWPGLKQRRPGAPGSRRRRGTCPQHPRTPRPPQEEEDEGEGELQVCAHGDVVRPPLPRTALFVVAVLSYGYLILPLSPYLSGLALGLGAGFILGLLLIQLGSSRSRSKAGAGAHGGEPRTLLGERGPEGRETLGAKPDVVKGWMNELSEYDPECYHPALTHSVLASLEGSCLRLDSPRCSISRRAEYDERPPHAAVLVRARTFQLAHSKVFLLPAVLASKRLWNPKYPICIQLAEGERPQQQEEQEEQEEEEEEERKPEENQGVEEEEQAAVKPAAQLRANPFKPTVATPTPASHTPTTTLYLFGRTGREKEEWFHHFLSASVVTERERPGRCVARLGMTALKRRCRPSPSILASRGPSRVGSSEDDSPSSPPFPSNNQTSSSRGPAALDYPSYMARLLATEQLSPLSSPEDSSTETSPGPKGKCTCYYPEFPEESQTAWVNALIGRIFWDFLREKYWTDAVSHKIQKKLSKIRLPYFMNELTLTELDMGSCLPQVSATSRPRVNHRGLWLEMELSYTGALQMTLQTKFNLTKLGKEGGLEMDSLTEIDRLGSRPVLSVLADSDEESSSAGSSDEEDFLLAEPQGVQGDRGIVPGAEGATVAGGGRTGRRILRFVDKIAKSKYFQKATENEFIRKKIEDMSNTPLLLAVEVQELSGTLVVNIPPPPTDRIWYSFCVPPKLDLRVRPKLGEREVTFCHVTEWIEKKLQDEFQKVFVLPNMDDIYLPLMHSGIDGPPVSQHSQAPSPRSRTSSMESIERIPQESPGPESE